MKASFIASYHGIRVTKKPTINEFYKGVENEETRKNNDR